MSSINFITLKMRAIFGNRYSIQYYTCKYVSMQASRDYLNLFIVRWCGEIAVNWWNSANHEQELFIESMIAYRRSLLNRFGDRFVSFFRRDPSFFFFLFPFLLFSFFSTRYQERLSGISNNASMPKNKRFFFFFFFANREEPWVKFPALKHTYVELVECCAKQTIQLGKWK